MSAAEYADWNGALKRAEAHAPFLARALERQPDLRALLAAGKTDAAFEWARMRGIHEDVGTGLRRERLALATTVAIGDLAGVFPLSKVVGELSGFADRALDRAIRTAMDDRAGKGEPDGFIALALGKQGSGELNYSSDIDPILLYDPATLRRLDSDDPGDAAQRYARRIVTLLSENTAEGYVLRVDLRLRPASEISPMAVPLGSAQSHYQGAALAWERAAFIRARAAAGDIAAGERFLERIRPFVWRSALDFGAIEEIRELTLRIRESYDGPVLPGPGFDVKRGRGGIREIEFFAQTHQLIHGGRDPSLTVRGTRTALDALAAAGRIDSQHTLILGEGYDRLRTIEHRLQMVNDRQTHSLPEGDALDNVALLDGLKDGAELVAELTALSERTGRIYEELIGQAAPVQMPVPKQSELAVLLGAKGFADPEALAQRIDGWRDGHFASLRSEAAIDAFDRLLPALLDAIAASDDPDLAITRWEGILERAPSAITLFRLLAAEPAVLDRLVATLTLTRTLSDELARRPELLDTLLDQRALELPGPVEDVVASIERAAIRPDYEASLDAIRSVTGDIRFALGVQLIEGMTDPLEVARALSRTAEAGLQVAMREAEAEFARTHGRIEDSELLVLGLGRLGGGALTHASDLDIVYLFTGDFTAESDGPRPLGATHYFNRLAGRVTAALSVPTAQGALYEVDTRLRPQGAQGPLAVSCDAFAKYQRETAWTWEHMALARARVLTGSAAARADLEGLLEEVLQSKRDHAQLYEAVRSMRSEMAKHKHPRGPLDVKLRRGGLVDLEFAVHYLQLKGRMKDGSVLVDPHPDAFDPDLGTAVSALIAADLLPAEIGSAHDVMTRALVAGRLLAPDTFEPPRSAAKALALACGEESFADLLSALDAARQEVAKVWNAIFGEALSLEDVSNDGME
ncbi:bifunctional [glutamate--ammonia ligase]-adenylyl-L-tyrosine phosphorylase/[glutamate--ammonia-ligase] adenylyltransferase [Erythrobacter crassostreae]|uniref:Bifunctional [glutamate--ammonia ligase]-adenylyl-L-tyrosine phosphorylase/[glutamate--ammonia-ligase] adenylyltransferase n=1 Tax=Erythrobacter crassostreae TaxID=2828328 RepID=A0A9X1F2D5_9SPHN|nr:bifunctional [glutamate--ammonia ligase]-adenylyl-L-tyrosine phosphorylase/[glutamate--ammonia-ligase] adenylyltransferase [Erythrobacter crassostrea]MBV7258726.1 bifunctional [glutamate--ammonia ligase]-adenylyl-L-tyrosine phosphorylase/[glutamate--ammonia-ligase] adenylyltransferase [Erythrobacter crassostrea]